VLVKLGSDRSYVYMTLSRISEENGENGAATSLSQIVIEGQGLGNSGTLLCLRIDTRLVAKNLTSAQIKFLVCEILDRIDGENEPNSSELHLH
jgi:hypothetical protein